MTTSARDLLQKHFDTAFSAPDGIAKMRELILTLAMQGKLVEQDPGDRTVKELLKQIKEAKEKASREGTKTRRKARELPPIEIEEAPHELPESWEWVRLGEIGIINPRNDAQDTLEAGFVPMPLVPEGYSHKHSFEKRKWGDIKKGFTHFSNGDVGMAKITPCFENAKSCIFAGLPNGIGAGTTELHIFRNAFEAIEPRFLLYFLKNPNFIKKSVPKMTGSAGQKRVPTPLFAETVFPLPPLSEQQRIVAKVDQLMEQCDELERLKKERDAKRLATHSAAIKQLTDPSLRAFVSSCEPFDFIQRHFHELYTVKANVTELRKAILQLAVMGKLVPQDPKDPPASELLNQIQAEKARLIKERKIKKPKPLPPIKSDEVPNELPEGWTWVRLGKVFLSSSGVTFSKNLEKDSGEVPYVKVADMNLPENSRTINTSSRFVDPDSKMLNSIIRSYSLIFPKRGGAIATNKKRIIKEPIFVDLNIMAITPVLSELMEYGYCWLLKIDLAELNTGTSVPQINHKDIDPLLFPLPPLPEQYRIVTKVDQLMALCDELELQIDASTAKKSFLLNAVMSQVA